jgi:predicted nuclease with RNAse H fold
VQLREFAGVAAGIFHSLLMEKVVDGWLKLRLGWRAKRQRYDCRVALIANAIVAAIAAIIAAATMSPSPCSYDKSRSFRRIQVQVKRRHYPPRRTLPPVTRPLLQLLKRGMTAFSRAFARREISDRLLATAVLMRRRALARIAVASGSCLSARAIALRVGCCILLLIIYLFSPGFSSHYHRSASLSR